METTISFSKVQTMLSQQQFAFVDCSCELGESIDYCEKIFGQKPGLRVYTNKETANVAQAPELAIVVCDPLSTSLPTKSVSFVSMMHFLEQVPDADTAGHFLTLASNLAKDFIFIRHSSFEDIRYLARLGLKLTWTDSSSRTNLMQIKSYQDLFERLTLEEYSVYAKRPIKGSRNELVVPIDAPRDTIAYNLETHGEKVRLDFDRYVYSEFDIFVKLNPKISETDWQALCAKAARKKEGATLVLDKRETSLFDIFSDPSFFGDAQ